MSFETSFPRSSPSTKPNWTVWGTFFGTGGFCVSGKRRGLFFSRKMETELFHLESSTRHCVPVLRRPLS